MCSLNPEILAYTILGIDAWLESMRGERGYSGPVAHRWHDCLIYTGTGFDWRYEGIISGYLRLHQATGEPRWLAKARRAGDDLLSAQLPDGRYPASSFEANPTPGGTPHEAACDLALLRLATFLKEAGDPAWEDFLSAARRNLVDYHIQKLWDPSRRSFCNLPGDPSLVPNKISTLVEAGFALSELEGRDDLLEQYFLPTLVSVLEAQVEQNGSFLQGAIGQSISGRQPEGRYFPYYAARCVPALLAVYRYGGKQIYLDAAVGATDFVLRCQLPDGSFPQVLYATMRQTVEPRWIAACGDILRSASLLAPYGYPAAKFEQTEAWLLTGVLPSGGIRTASGFAALETFHPQDGLPEMRDLLPVCGWVDKAFHYLAWQIPTGWQFPLFAGVQETSEPCIFRGQKGLFLESETCIQVIREGEVLYHWQKGQPWSDFD
jgi:hypothetical protein